MDRYLDKFNYEKDYRNKTRPEEFTDQKNIASQNLLKKLGFELNGKIVLPNEDDELFLFRFKKFI